jgi:transglutaminase/protease-like cytokinesis protein 3
MELRRLLFVLLLIGFASCNDAGARRTNGAARRYPKRPHNKSVQSNIVAFDLTYDIYAQQGTYKIRFVVVLPQTICDRQQILGIEYSPKPSRIFNANGNRYAEFLFVRPERREKVQISVRAELLRYDLSTARGRAGAIDYEDGAFDEFLKHEKYIETDHSQIQQIAESIEGEREIDIVRNIYDYVVDTMDYTSHKDKDWGSVKAVELKKGDCTEYSDLFAALCRAKNIPARFTLGYTVRFDDVSAKHNWVEVFLGDYGWVPFDPSWGDIDNLILRDMAFSRLRPVYIYLTNIRHDGVINNYHFAGYTYWGDRARVKDSIEFKSISPTFRKAR